MDDSPAGRRGSKVYQIFPEANTNEDPDSSSMPEDFLYKRERLPSIVVEPIDHRLPEGVERLANNLEEEEEDDRADHTEDSADGEQEHTRMEESTTVRKSSIGPSQSQLCLSRLTPPASPTHIEAAPPCQRSLNRTTSED
ncbi:protein LBH-like isoform X2 [Eleginops maclovinus]